MDMREFKRLMDLAGLSDNRTPRDRLRDFMHRAKCSIDDFVDSLSLQKIINSDADDNNEVRCQRIPELLNTISFKSGLLNFGDVNLAENAYQALVTDDLDDRMATGELVRQALAEIMCGSELDWPIYEMDWLYSADTLDERIANYSENRLACLKFLPNFKQTARMFVFYRKNYQSSLCLAEIWHSDDPALGCIDTSSFLSKYQVALDDHNGFRESIISVLKNRGVKSSLLFKE
jgi:hypothetical protein